MNRLHVLGILIGLSLGCGGSRVSPVTEVSASAAEPTTDSVNAASNLSADDWPSWRGANMDGITSGPAVPTHWTDTENVKWKVKIPGRGHSSPILVGDRIYLETADEKTETQSVLCLERDDGSQVWQKTLHKGKLDRNVHKENTQASSTLICDGERLYALFLNDAHIWATAIDLEGNVVWKKDVGGFKSKFGFSSSPSLYKSMLLLAADHQQGGFIAALKCESGEVVWRKKRPAKSSYASPRVVTLGGRDQMLLGGCNLLSSYDPMTGEELWKTKGTAEAGVGTPVVTDDLVFASGGYPEQNTLAVDAKGKVIWQKKVKSYVPSLLAFEGHVYAVPDDGVFYCFEAKTGKEKWKKRVGGNFRVSPILNDGNIFTTDMSGKTTVFKADPAQFEIVAENQLGTEGFSSPAVSKGQLFLRVADSSKGPRQEWIYCIGH